MKRFTLLLTAVALMSSLALSAKKSASLAANDQGRVEVNINRDWTFNYYPSGEEKTEIAKSDFDDSHWKAIALPHTWSTYETTRDVHPYIMMASERDDSFWWNGWGYYRKHLTLGNELRGKRMFVEFDGVQKYGKVYFNGHLLGDHKGGYCGFYFDVTPYVNFGGDNLLTVAVSNRRDDKFGTIPPATAGNFNVYGGIYRSVKFVVKNTVYIPYQGSYKHEGGTFVTTPEVSEKQATVNVKTYVKNDDTKALTATLTTTVVSPKGKKIISITTSQRIAPGEISQFDQTLKPVKSPQLWSAETPTLYTVKSEVKVDGKTVDTYTSPLGFRTFSWDFTDNKLIVNGKKMHIHGTNRHQEFPWLGDAMPEWLTLRDMLDIRNGMNTNFMRTAHYPHDPLVYDFNDRHGIVTVVESPNIKPIDFGRDIQENNMREMVRHFRNHPSVMFWSVGNESANAGDSRWVHEEDTTRIIHERKTEGYDDYVTHHATNLDMENLLRVTIRGWYNKDVKNLEPVNEPGVEKSGQYAGTEEWQHKMARIDGGSIRGRIDGDVVGWLYEDHGCDRMYKDAPLKNINYKGWVDLYRIPKYMYYLWQANYLPEPMVYIQPHHWREVYLGQRKDIQVDSNCDSVELFVNGKSYGVKHPSKDNFFTVTFSDVAIERGEIKAVATRGGKKVEQAIEMAGTPARVVLTAERGRIPADRSGIDIVTADVVDARGNRVVGFSGDLTWEVIGEGTLAGHNLYTSDIDKTLAVEGTGYVVTPVPNLVRSTSRPGIIKVRVTSPGLEAAEVEIVTEAVDSEPVSGVSQPLLSDTGRVAIVEKDTDFRERVTYQEEMGRVFSPQRFEGKSADDFEVAMRKFVLKHNPEIDKKSIEFKALVKRLGSYLAGTNGEFTEDDYNFIAQTYNSLRLLSRTVDSRNFHPDYRQELVKHYSAAMLTDGKIVDVTAELAMIDSIPREIDVMYIRNPQKSSQILPILYGNTSYRYSAVASTLEAALELLHPGEYSSLPAEKQRSLLAYLARINPSITIDGTVVTFKFDKPIAIPRNITAL